MATIDYIIERIDSGLVTVEDFDRLIKESTPKSAEERIARHKRVVSGPRIPTVDGSITPKKVGINNPVEQGRGRKFASGKPAKERQNKEQKEKAIRSKVTDSLNILKNNTEVDVSKLTVEEATILRAVCESNGSESAKKFIGLIDENFTRLDDYAYKVSIATITEQVREKSSRTYTITGPDDQLDKLEKFFDWMSTNCSAGHSAACQFYVDGDGQASIKVVKSDGELVKPEKDEIESSGKFELSLGIGD